MDPVWCVYRKRVDPSPMCTGRGMDPVRCVYRKRVDPSPVCVAKVECTDIVCTGGVCTVLRLGFV